jgi:patatin-like phospholipase/acyl hydrolase
MNKIYIIFALFQLLNSKFSILSLDSGRYEGYMTARFVSYMEQYAYTVAKRDLCIPERASQRISMTELFDMISGSETGAIIASSINLANKTA